MEAMAKAIQKLTRSEAEGTFERFKVLTAAIAAVPKDMVAARVPKPSGRRRKRKA